jgi:peptidyl-prolyl cis-trans isomerase D
MITWIQKYFQRHFRLVFGLILLAMAVPLVVVYSQSSGVGRSGPQATERAFFGHDLNNEEVMSRAMADASHSLQLSGNFRADPSQVQQRALSRLAGLALADQLHLPAPTEKEVGTYIAGLRVFQDAQGNFDQKRYSDFAAGLAVNKQFTIADANRVFHDDARLEALAHLVGGPGYVLPADVRDILKHTDTKWSVAIASLDYASFNPGLNVTEDALKKYYEDNVNRYEVGPRAKLSQVLFRLDEFVPPGAPTDAQVRAYYDSNPARFPPPAEKDEKTGLPKLDAPKPATADNFAKVRPQVEAAMRRDASTRAAMKAATDFTVALYQQKAAANSPELAAFLAGAHRTATPLPPFLPDAPPPELAWLGYHGEEIGRLSKDRYFSDPLNAPDGVVVLLWNDTLPAYKPLLPEVHDKVAADYKDAEKRERFIAEGRTLRARLEAALKAGTSFEKSAEADKLGVKSYTGFTLSEPPKDAPAEALQSLASMNAGQVGEMIASGDKGYFVYVAQKQLPDLTPANPRYAEINSRISQYLAGSTDDAVLNSMVESELQKSAPATGTR